MTTAIVGRTGSGKTYVAKGLVEGFLNAGERTCIIDPTGAWWGLRALGMGHRRSTSAGRAHLAAGGEERHPR